MSDNLFETLYAGFAKSLDRPFLCCPDDGAYSYRDVVERSGEFAAALKNAGCGIGDRVVVQVEKSADAIALYLACLRTGVVYVPLNVAYTANEVAYYLENATPHAMICRPQEEDVLTAIARDYGVEEIRTLGTSGDGSLSTQARKLTRLDETEPRAHSDLAAMLYTSGTTGKPKGAMITHENLATNARALSETWAWQSEDVLLHALPVFHVHGLFIALHCAMLGGSTVEFLPRFEVSAVRAALPRATVLMGVPTFYRRLLAETDFDHRECAHMRVFISGSAPLPETVFREFATRTGHTILERYGMTETGILTSNPLDGDRLAGTVGYPLPGVEARVVDKDGTPCAEGETGEVEVRGPGIFRGYWNEPDKTEAAFRADLFFRTGDFGTQTEEGRLTLVGRGSDLIISGGYNIYPKEIELCLDETPGVAESAVVGLPHPDLGEGVTAFLVRNDPTLTEAMIKERLGDHLARFKQPKRFFFVESLPRNAMGKIQKTVLRTKNAKVYEPR